MLSLAYIRKAGLHPLGNNRPLLIQRGIYGTIGLSLAIVGTSLMLLNLCYLLRKSIPFLHRFGSLRRWMAFHIVTGLVGPAMITLHSGFLATSSFGALSFGGSIHC